MRYRLSTLNFILAVAPPGLAVLWFLSHSIAGMIGWTAFASLFVVWYLSLLKSQAMDPRKRGAGASE
jgi:hypothetical protein